MFDTYHADYQDVQASQAAVALKGQLGKGMTGDYLDTLLVVPTTVSPGVITMTDGGGAFAGPTISLFAGGANSLADLKPFFIKFKGRSINGAWTLTTGAGLSVKAIGRFQ